MFNFKKLNLPIIQAPMAGGMNTPRLAAEVANSGGVGSFGFAYSTPQKIAEELAETQKLTSGPINANFFVFQPVELPDLEIQNRALIDLKSLPIATGCEVLIPNAPFYPSLDEQLEPVWHHKPEILTFHFGIPKLQIIEKAHSLGIVVGISATSLYEANLIQKSGADFIVAQGVEAGGHRGIFNPSHHDDYLSTVDLTTVLSKQCSVPIVAAGGIMNGADIQDVIKAGASAAQLGTAFLCCDEAGTSDAHKNFLLNKHQRGTVFTKAFSGRMARGIRNEFIDRIANSVVLPFPIQNSMTASIRQLAAKNGDAEYQSLWAGTAYPKTRSLTAKNLMKALKQELIASQM